MKKQSKVEITEPKVKKSASERIKSVTRWLDRHVLPFVSLIVLSALAVKGLSVYLPMLTENARLVASIMAVAILVVKLKAEA